MRKDILLKILVTLAGLLVFAKVVTVLLLNYRLPKELRQICTENGCDLKSATVRADWVGSGLEIRDLVIRSKDSADGFFLYLPLFRMDGIHIFSIWFRDRMVARDLYVESARLEFKARTRKDTSSWRLPVPVRIRSVALHDVSVLVRDTTGIRHLRCSGADASFRFIDLKKNEILSGHALVNFSLAAREVFYMGSDSLYHYGINGMVYDTEREHFSAREIFIEPNYAGYAFAARLPHQQDCIRATFQEVSCTRLSAGECLETASLACNILQVGEMKIDVFRDRRKPDTQKRMPMVQEALHALPLRLAIDTIILGTGSIAYTEHVKETDQATTVRFTEVSARCSGITNDSNTAHRFLELETHAQLLGSTPLHCNIRGKLFDPMHTLQIHGNLGSMQATDFNAILEKSGPLSIKSGVLDRMQFSFRLNSKASDGTMKLLYHDLDINVNKKFTPNPVSLLQTFLLVLGTGQIMESNPRKNDPVREGIISVPRDPQKSIFNYCLQSLLSGSQWTMTKEKVHSQRSTVDKRRENEETADSRQ